MPASASIQSTQEEASFHFVDLNKFLEFANDDHHFNVAITHVSEQGVKQASGGALLAFFLEGIEGPLLKALKSL